MTFVIIMKQSKGNLCAIFQELLFLSLAPVAYRNSEGPPKSCQTQPDCENC